MIKKATVLATLPTGLREPLFVEFEEILNNYAGGKWKTAELSGARFSEIVYTILEGYPFTSTYSNTPKKPARMVDDCRKLENKTGVPRSFQILIPRLLPALYEIRNNRDVGHVGGDVDSNHMDSLVVVSICSWIMAELVRVFHGLTVDEAQKAVDSLVEYRTPLVWTSEEVSRILDPKMKAKDKVLALLYSKNGKATSKQLFEWTEYKNITKFNSLLGTLHVEKKVEFNSSNREVILLPPGLKEAQEIIARYKS